MKKEKDKSFEEFNWLLLFLFVILLFYTFIHTMNCDGKNYTEKEYCQENHIKVGNLTWVSFVTHETFENSKKETLYELRYFVEGTEPNMYRTYKVKSEAVREFERIKKFKTIHYYYAEGIGIMIIKGIK